MRAKIVCEHVVPTVKSTNDTNLLSAQICKVLFFLNSHTEGLWFESTSTFTMKKDAFYKIFFFTRKKDFLQDFMAFQFRRIYFRNQEAFVIQMGLSMFL